RTAIESCLLNGVTTVDECALGWTVSNLIGNDGDSLNPGYDAQEGLTIEINTDGTALILAEFGGNAATALHESALSWGRTAQGNWTCGTDVDEKFRPTSCNGELGEASDDPQDP